MAINNNKFIPIIGLEIHVELKTKSKMFCGCRNDPFHAAKPNIYTCPVCLGLPGALPVPNKRAIEQTVMLGLALSCGVNKESRFDRKHYFYPDLPKGYQISQYEKPFCVEGVIKIGEIREIGEIRGGREIRIRRVHLEEDTGKLLHRKIAVSFPFGFAQGQDDEGRNIEEVSLIDFNRSGVPLAEIVTEPDIRSAEEAKLVAQKIQRIVRFLGISDADMEKGSMRLEANISLLGDGPRRHFFATLGLAASLDSISSIRSARDPRSLPRRLSVGSESSVLSGSSSMISEIPSSARQEIELPNYKVELKNINSFRFLERAINLEIERQKRILLSNKVVKQQTFGWDTEKMELKPQRVKEEAADYRYFPEPDIPPIRLTDRRISKIRNQISYLPDEVFENLIKTGISEQAAEVISSNKAVAEAVERGIRGIRGARGKRGEIGEIRDFGNWMVHHQDLAKSTSAEKLVETFRKEKTEVVGDEKMLSNWVKASIAAAPQAVEDYRKGKEAALQYLIGQVQRKAKGKADVLSVKKLLLDSLLNC